MAASGLLSRILGLLRDSVIASSFGLLAVNDSYRIAMQVPDLIFMLIAGGGLSSAFLPVFAELIHTNREREAEKLFSVVVTLCTVIASVIVMLAWIAAPAIVNYMGAGHTAAVLQEATTMSRIVLPAQISFLVGSILLGSLYARQKFLAPALAPNVYNVGIIVGAAVVPWVLGLNIEWVAWGALAGAVIGNVVIPSLVLASQRVKFQPSLDYRTAGVSKFFRLLVPVILGFSLPSMVQIITQKFASGYGEGANTVLTYSTNLMMAPLGIFGQSLALAAFPVLAQFAAQQKMDMFRDHIARTMRTVAYLCIPTAGLMFATAPLLVHIIYGYGKAGHDVAQLDLIAQCLRIYCLAIVPWCLQPILIRGFFSLHETVVPIAIGTAMTAVYIVCCLVVTHSSLGLFGMPWATGLCALGLVIALVLVLQRRVGAISIGELVRTIGKAGIATLGMAAPLYIATQSWWPASRGLQIGYFLGLCLIGSWIYYFATRAMKMPETNYLDRVFKRGKLSR